jgi:hypothetical protein
MGAFRVLVSRVWSLVSKRRDEVLMEEIDAHLDLLEAEHLSRGRSRRQGRRIATSAGCRSSIRWSRTFVTP